MGEDPKIGAEEHANRNRAMTPPAPGRMFSCIRAVATHSRRGRTQDRVTIEDVHATHGSEGNLRREWPGAGALHILGQFQPLLNRRGAHRLALQVALFWWISFLNTLSAGILARLNSLC